jgi:hypothetical protein
MSTDIQSALSETIHSVLTGSRNPSAEEIARRIVNRFGLEQEWAVADYEGGELSHVHHHDYDFGSVNRGMRSLSGDVGIVTRFFTHWRKV